jgi:hypothetical protein
MRTTGLSVAPTHRVFQRYDPENGLMSLLNVKIRHSGDKLLFQMQRSM